MALRRVAQIPLGVRGVVEPPVGDRRARDGGVEHVRPPQHRQRRQVAAERPAPDRDPAQVEVGVGHRLEHVDLVVEGDREVVVDLALEGRAASGRAAPVGDDHGEALLGPPLGLQEHPVGVEHPLGVRPAVGVHEDGQLWPTLDVPRRQQHRRGELTGARPRQRDAQVETGPLGHARDRRRTAVEPDHPHRHALVVERLGHHDGHAAAAAAGEHARVGREGLRVPCAYDQSWTCAESPPLAVKRTTFPSTSTTPGPAATAGVTAVGPTNSRRPPSASATQTTAPSAVCAGDALRRLDPLLVGVLADQVVPPVVGSTESSRSDFWSRASVTMTGPKESHRGGDQVFLLERHLGADPVEAHDVEVDPRVVRPGRRVGDRDRVAAGVGRVGDVPDLHRRRRRPARPAAPTRRATTSSRASGRAPPRR